MKESCTCSPSCTLSGYFAVGHIQEEHSPQSEPPLKDRDKPIRLPFGKPPLFWVRIFLGAIFILASVDKVIHPSLFADIIKNYGILPGVLINPAAIILPWLELAVGIFLILGFWLPGSAAMATLMLSVFFGALLFNFIRGVDVACGCFSTAPTSGHSMILNLLRDGVLVTLSWCMLISVYGKSVSRRLL